MLLERNGKLTMWKSPKSSRLSYSLVESLPPHKYLMPVMIDFVLIRWRSSCAKQSGCRVRSMKQLYFHTSSCVVLCYNERKSIIFALSATSASFRLMTCFIHNETAIIFVWKKCQILPRVFNFPTLEENIFVKSPALR